MDKFDAEWVRANDDKILKYAEELHKRILQLEKLVHYPYLAGKEQVERIAKLEAEVAREKKEEHLYAPLRSDTAALLDMATLLRGMVNFKPNALDTHEFVFEDFRRRAKAILEKYSK